MEHWSSALGGLPDGQTGCTQGLHAKINADIISIPENPGYIRSGFWIQVQSADVAHASATDKTMNNQKTHQEFPFTVQPSTITTGARKGETEIHLRERFTPAKMEGDTRVTSARVGVGHNAEMALILFQKKPAIVETDVLHGPCVVRTAGGLQTGKLKGHHGTPESMCVIIADLKPLAGRTLVMARLGACKVKLAQKYGRLAAKSASQGRRVVLIRKMIGFRTAARAQWQKVFQTLARSPSAN